MICQCVFTNSTNSIVRTASVCDVNGLGDVANVTDPHLEVECDNVTGVFGDVCWLKCKYDQVLKNDDMETDILAELLKVMNEAGNTYNNTT